MTIHRKISKTQDLLDQIPEEQKQQTARNCGLCSHQAICSVFMLYKTQVEPAILDPSVAPKAEDLAWVCKSYLPKQLD